MQFSVAAGGREEGGRLPADQELMMKSRGRVEAVAVGGHDAEICRPRGEDNANGRKKEWKARGEAGRERTMRMAEAGCSVIRV